MYRLVNQRDDFVPDPQLNGVNNSNQDELVQTKAYASILDVDRLRCFLIREKPNVFGKKQSDTRKDMLAE